MKYKVFDARFKIDNVKRFLYLKEHSPFKMGYGSYAKSINVNKATFVAWVKKYQENKLYYCDSDTDGDDQSLLTVNGNNSDFINLSEDRFEVVNINDDLNSNTTTNVMFPNINSNTTNTTNMSLKINGGVIEFDSSCLKKVIEVLKSC